MSPAVGVHEGEGLEPLRKGWCPGALRPMMARDGLLLRLRLTGGRLEADQAHALAALAAFYGNGLFDLSARGNLQMRGVDPEGLTSFLDALADLGLLDADADGEAVRNVIASPLAGLGEGFDIGPLVRDLEARLVADESLHALPPKFGFLIDDGRAPTLAGIAADIRFDLVADGSERVFVGLGGTRDRAVSLGICRPDEVVEAALWSARTFLSLAATCQPPVRRMAQLVTRLGAYQTGRAFGIRGDAPRPAYAAAILDRPPVGLRTEGGLPVLGLAVPFGRLDQAMLHALADVAQAHGQSTLRLTPWRCILVPGIRETFDGAALQAQGFILDPADPRLRIAACTGMAGCERGTTPTQADATRLVDLVAQPGKAAVSIHVSGCEKGCAKASRTPLTLVGRDGRYDLVVQGKASDAPEQRGLDLDGVRAFIQAMKASA